MLWPGDQEVGARYREKIYLFSSPDNKTKFLENPQKYAPSEAPLSVINPYLSRSSFRSFLSGILSLVFILLHFHIIQ